MTDAERIAQLEDAGPITREEAELQLKVAANHAPSTPISLHRFKVLAESYLALLDSGEQTIRELREQLASNNELGCNWANGSPTYQKLQRERAVSDGLAAALKEIWFDSRCVPDKFFSDSNGDCTMADCRCANRIAHAALARHAALRSSKTSASSEPTGTDDDLIPRATDEKVTD